jgi:hypothetical protein
LYFSKILDYLPKEKDGSLSFIVFLKFLQWIESADDDEKIKATFGLLNNGDDLDSNILDKVLSELYPNATKVLTILEI